MIVITNSFCGMVWCTVGKTQRTICSFCSWKEDSFMNIESVCFYIGPKMNDNTWKKFKMAATSFFGWCVGFSTFSSCLSIIYDSINLWKLNKALADRTSFLTEIYGMPVTVYVNICSDFTAQVCRLTDVFSLSMMDASCMAHHTGGQPSPMDTNMLQAMSLCFVCH